ncbi:MAG: hypothetical protein AAF624_06455 [Bacteroidota bacterium]
MSWRRNLLWVDCTGALVAGVLVLALSGWLADLHGLPRSVLLFTGMMNLAYGSFSFSLARRTERPRPLLSLLASANMAWPLVCIALVVMHRAAIGPTGLLHLLGEAVYVGGLGFIEWQSRDLLLQAAA